MKRSEITVESLKALGYKAMVSQENVWHFQHHDYEANKKQSQELFELVVAAANVGTKIEVRHILKTATVVILIPDAVKEVGSSTFTYYLSRPMTQEEMDEEGIIKENDKIILNR